MSGEIRQAANQNNYYDSTGQCKPTKIKHYTRKKSLLNGNVARFADEIMFMGRSYEHYRNVWARMSLVLLPDLWKISKNSVLKWSKKERNIK